MSNGKKIDESQLKLSWIARREYALRVVSLLQSTTPTPFDLAAVAVTISEISREACAHALDVTGLEREQLSALLERVSTEERKAARETSASMLARAQA